MAIAENHVSPLPVAEMDGAAEVFAAGAAGLVSVGRPAAMNNVVMSANNRLMGFILIEIIGVAET